MGMLTGSVKNLFRRHAGSITRKLNLISHRDNRCAAPQYHLGPVVHLGRNRFEQRGTSPDIS